MDIVKKLNIVHKFDQENNWKTSNYIFNENSDNMIVLLGLNPAFSGNEITDRTNLKIINTILETKELENVSGYMLHNLSNVQEKDSDNINEESFIDSHTEFVISELENLNKENKILCVFYGPTCMKNHTEIVERYRNIFNSYLEDERLYFITDDNGFKHPSIHKGTLSIKLVSDIDLIIPPVSKK